MKRIFFILLIISLISLASAGEIRVSCPEEVSVNEEFNCEVETVGLSNDNYDIKIDILSNEERIAEIYSETWKSTYYYVLDAIGGSNTNSFRLRIKQDFSSAEILVKLRDSKGNIYSAEKKEIFSKEGSSLEEESVKVDEEESNIEDETPKKVISVKVNNSETYETSEVTEVMRHFTASAIRIDSKDIKSDEISVIKTRNSILIYSLIGFGLLVTLLILLKRINFTKDEWRE